MNLIGRPRTVFTSATVQLVHGRFERLARRIAMSGLMTRGEAERCIRSGDVLVDGRAVSQNCVVADGATVVVRDTLVPAPGTMPRVWAVRKPEGLACKFRKTTARESIVSDGETAGQEAGRCPSTGSTSRAAAEAAESERYGPPCLSDLFHNYRIFDVQRRGPGAVDKEQHDDRLLPHYSIVNPLKTDHEGLLVLTNCGRFREVLKNPDLCPVETVYDCRLQTTDDGSPAPAAPGFTPPTGSYASGDGWDPAREPAFLAGTSGSSKTMTTGGKYRRRRSRSAIPVSMYPEILRSWATKGVRVRGIDYGRVHANLTRRNAEEGSTWIRVRMLERPYTCPELLLYEELGVRVPVVRRITWGKLRLNHVPEQTVFPVSLGEPEGAWLVPFIPARPRTTELLRCGDPEDADGINVEV
ncbi:unnamed protein product [Amoebophrya sp. A25]|nr:unnamed protein product [Amoebophrya sp. A25]|eukprot:GSA25T00025970001.1